MHDQGYLNKPKRFFRDNQNDMRMEATGREFHAGNSRHIYFRYFSIKD